MALAAVQPVMDTDQNKGLHPFFAKPSKTQPPNSDSTARLPATETSHETEIEPQESSESKAPKKRGRKLGSKNVKKREDALGNNKQPSLELFTRRLNKEDVGTGATHIDDKDTMIIPAEQDSIESPRKRRRTASPSARVSETLVNPENRAIGEIKEGSIQSPIPAGESFPQALLRDITPPIDIPNSDLHTQAPAKEPNPSSMPNPGPKRLLTVTKNGKLLSSPPPESDQDSTTPRKRRTRRAVNAKPLKMMVVINYGRDPIRRETLGESITAILEGKKSSPGMSISTKPSIQPPAKPPAKSAGPPKSTHPFFLGKPAQKQVANGANNDRRPDPPSQLPNVHRKSAVTPGKIRTECRNEKPDFPAPGATFGNVRNVSKNSKNADTEEAPWPSKGTAHIRNLDADAAQCLPSYAKHCLLKDPKLKKKFFAIPDDQQLITKLSHQLQPFMGDALNHSHGHSQSDFQPPPDVRLPTRLLTTGAIIQEKVRGQVYASLHTFNHHETNRSPTHPAIQSLFSKIEHTLTPFDLGQCESQSWIQKHAPRQTSHVLQLGQEALILQDWLRNLTVLTVGGAQSGSKTSDAKKPPKKKRKKAKDDFIVDSDDEEEEEMIEVYGGRDMPTTSHFKSTRRARWTRDKNVVILSGPSGCGKSAMVYAVAKEMGFEVFEINSGSRRSGKDIFDKVGDMSENHLVNHRQKDPTEKLEAASADDTETDRHSEAFQKDVDSGRQRTMASFFKPKNPSKTSPKVTKAKTKAVSAKTSHQATLAAEKVQRITQKQSLILFEEADILFEEDQQFWSSVTKLASLSKRPIIVTCNEESMIPSAQLPLAAILRLSPPSSELAVDYMLVLAGYEGHVIKRDAISSLYEYKRHDLRASITELDLWCQMSVGDRKGGLEWMYQRWPPGKDVDENGHILRVASEDTYMSGMGCISHNISESMNNVAFDRQNELLKETWNEWAIAPTDWSFGRTETGCRPPSQEATSLGLLKELEAMTESASAAALYSRVDLPSYARDYDQPIDPSLPPIPGQEYLNYTTSLPVRQIDSVIDYSKMDADLLTQTYLLIQRVYGDQLSFTSKGSPLPTTEADFAEGIVHRLQKSQLKKPLAREDFSVAFDILGYQPDATPAVNATYNLLASSLDRQFRVVVEDIAPYIRSIVSYETFLDAQRVRLGNLLSEGGQGTKRSRTTRAARTALEGGERRSKRKDRWFSEDLDRVLVMHTGSETWLGLGLAVTAEGTETGSQKAVGSPSSSSP
ncbi:unnamed protein product [Periconia digitata]|uniref:AAA+ ATPase domain-containing protein n=1 Tax=Periconia digitata TaxID=1303443 RepID=A0A9W4UVE3_9PLEO|nr:unnamed protein product [Periconia digitata]